ncbi:MAG: hypothetical protein HUU19_13325 [Phycisphaerales bacterium]|nr:hypothetical protein [Phycisphaerales bacterium]
MKNVASPVRSLLRAAALTAGLALAASVQAGTWTKVVNNPPGSAGLMLLLNDGTVMVTNPGVSAAWYKLTPNAKGSYINGTWTTLASAPHTRLYFQSEVLKDGRVYVSGGEYGTGGPYADMYNPATNSWTNLAIPTSLWSTASNDFYDGNMEVRPDGSLIMMPVFPHAPGIPIIYNPYTNVWSNGGKLFRGTWQDEASWAKLPDDSILTIDPWGTFSERYIPATNTWVNDGVVPVAMYDPFGFELGGAYMLPNGKAMFLGSTGNTVFYTPTGNTSPGVWTTGPVIPSNRGTPDAPACPMPNGKVLCAVSAVPTSANHFPSPTYFYEFDYTTNTFTNINGPTGNSDAISAYQAMFLMLPTGEVMYTHMSNTVYVYNPGGSPLAAAKPSVTSISKNGDGSYHLVGKNFNGINEGATYGDDWQMNTNRPLVRFFDDANPPNVWYATTFNWSRSSVMTGNATVTTEFKKPASLPANVNKFVVVVNGVASDTYRICPADLNHDGFVNGNDYDLFASFFDAGSSGADYNDDGFVNGDDYDAFSSDFEGGC